MFSHHVRFSHCLPFLRKQLNEVYLAHSIDGFVFSLIGIFIPIYLLTLGYSVVQVLVFFLVEALAASMASFLVGCIASRLGLKHTIFLRFPFVIAFLVLLYLLDYTAVPLFLIALLGGFQIALYWIPLQSLFARSCHDRQMGFDVSRLFSFFQITSVMAPIIGGFVALFLGFNTLFLIAIILLCISMIPLFFTAEIKPHVQFRISEGFRLFKKYPRYFFATLVIDLAYGAEYVVWPLFVYILLSSTLSLGIIGSLLGLGTALFTLVIGKLSDRIKRRTIIRSGAMLVMLVWFFRAFSTTSTHFYLLTILAGFFTVLIWIPLTSMTYNIAKKENIDEVMVFRGIPSAIGKTVIFVAGMVLATKLELTFLLAGISHIFFFFF